MKFEVYGPFRIPRKNRIIARDDLGAFWEGVESEETGLATACGCYVFALQPSGGPTLTPWYIGKAEKSAFRKEALNSANLNKYNELLAKWKRAKPMLFLLPQITPQGKFFRKPTTGKRPAIRALESLLIGMAINQNPDLLNIRGTRMLREISVSGFLNTPRLARGGAGKELRNAFGR